jgi:hypothetical protein
VDKETLYIHPPALEKTKKICFYRGGCCCSTVAGVIFSVVSALAEDFTESDLPFKVDVVDWATTKEAFREIIEKEHVVVQNGDEKKKEHVG